MHTQSHGAHRRIALILGVVAALFAAAALADPPTRVARVGYVNGPVSFSPAGEDDWVQATLNRPLVTGDRLWADVGARVELQIGAAVIRLGAATSVTLINLDDRVAQFQLAQGTLNVRVHRLNPDQLVEIDTPNLAYVIRRAGQYQISVDANGEATQVSTSSGQAEVYGEGASYVVGTGKSYRFAGAGLHDYQDVALPRGDEFDRWAQERDRSYDNSASARYVSRDVIGAQDLDAYGSWRAVPEYGNVWTPTRVSADWAPYRDGHWAWIDPWGWTWVDDAPWGFAVSHYGRWASIGGGWGWIPGPVAARAVYAPALVAFIGGSNFQVTIASGNVGAVGWFPLGPRDVYRPAYPVSRAYFNNVNVTNTVINTTNITNIYNNQNATNITYANRQVAGAVVTVPTTAFVQSQPVARAAVRVPREAVVAAPVTTIAAVTPVAISVRGAAPQGPKPPAQALERRVVAKSAPPAAPVAFAAREHAMANSPGKPVDAAAVATSRPTTAAIAPKIAVVAPPPNSRPIAAPPPHSASRGNDRRPEEAQVKAPTPQPAAAPAPPQAQLRGSPPPAPFTPPPTAPAESAKAPPQRGPGAAPRESVQAPLAVARPPQVNAAPSRPAQQEQRDTARVVPTPPVPVVAPQVIARPPQANAPAPMQAEQSNKPEPRVRPPVTVLAPPPPHPAPEPQRAQPSPQAAAKPMQSAPPTPAPVARPPEHGQAPGQAKPEQRGKEARTGDNKGDEPGKGDEEPKRK